jgi:hypothetical protein
MSVICEVLFQASQMLVAIRDCAGLEPFGIAIAGGKLATCPPAWQLKLTKLEEAAISPAA